MCSGRDPSSENDVGGKAGLVAAAACSLARVHRFGAATTRAAAGPRSWVAEWRQGAANGAAWGSGEDEERHLAVVQAGSAPTDQPSAGGGVSVGAPAPAHAQSTAAAAAIQVKVRRRAARSIGSEPTAQAMTREPAAGQRCCLGDAPEAAEAALGRVCAPALSRAGAPLPAPDRAGAG